MQDNDVSDVVGLLQNLSQLIANGYSRPKGIQNVMLRD